MPAPMMYPGDYLLDGLLYAAPATSTADLAHAVVDERGEPVLAAAQELTEEFASVMPRLSILDNYYRGHPPLPTNPERMTQKYKALVAMSVSNWASLVVDVVDERLQVKSVRSTEFPIRDEVAWSWWQANNLDSVSSQVHVEALKFGYAYVTVWSPSCEDCPPVILGESPMSAYATYDSATGECIEAIRIDFDRRLGRFVADYTTPDYQFGLISRGEVSRQSYMWGPYAGIGRPAVVWDYTALSWQFRAVDGVPMVRANPLGQVPYIRLRTKPDLLGGFQSEMESILPIQDRIIQTTFDRLLTQEFAAFPQRWVTGLDVPVDPATGAPKEPWDAAVDRVWTSDDPGSRFGQFDAASLDGYLSAVTHDIQALSSQSRTPPHYLISGMGVFPSGESVRATEYGLSRKVANRQQSYSDAWGDALRLAGRVAGDERLANDEQLTVAWEDVEAHSDAERADALLKLSQVPGVSTDVIASEAGRLVMPELPPSEPAPLATPVEPPSIPPNGAGPGAR